MNLWILFEVQHKAPVINWSKVSKNQLQFYSTCHLIINIFLTTKIAIYSLICLPVLCFLLIVSFNEVVFVHLIYESDTKFKYLHLLLCKFLIQRCQHCRKAKSLSIFHFIFFWSLNNKEQFLFCSNQEWYILCPVEQRKKLKIQFNFMIKLY